MTSACLMMRLARQKRLIGLPMAGMFVIFILGGRRIRLFLRERGVRGVLGSEVWMCVRWEGNRVGCKVGVIAKMGRLQSTFLLCIACLGSIANQTVLHNIKFIPVHYTNLLSTRALIYQSYMARYGSLGSCQSLHTPLSRCYDS